MRKGNVSAEGNYLGYSLQLSRLLHLLLSDGGADAVSIECIGDVAIESPEHKLTIEELKSRTSRSNPISDRAIDLWKTIMNWMKIVEAGVDPARTEFRLHTTLRFKSNLAGKMHNVKSSSEANAVIQEATDQFDAKKPGKTLAKFTNFALSGERRKVLQALLPSVRLSQGYGDSRAELMELLSRSVVPDEHLGDVLEHLLGWVKLLTDGKIEKGEPAVVKVSAFRRELIAIVRKLDRQTVLNSYAPIPSKEDVSTNLQTRVFVRQLELVDSDDDIKLRAVHDYLRAKADGIHWTKRALIHTSDLEEAESDLKAVWNNKRTIVELRDTSRSEPERGRILLHECLQHRCRIQGMDPPPYFTAGAYHGLADDMAIGWHPKYSFFLGTPTEET